MPTTDALNKVEIVAQTDSLIDEVVSVVATGGVQQRLRILQHVTDLFVMGSRSYSGQQIVLFDDLVQQLSADIEVSARSKRINWLL